MARGECRWWGKTGIDLRVRQEQTDGRAAILP